MAGSSWGGLFPVLLQDFEEPDCTMSSLPLESEPIILDCFFDFVFAEPQELHLFFQFFDVFSDCAIVSPLGRCFTVEKKKKLELVDVYRCTICTEIVTFCSHR